MIPFVSKKDSASSVEDDHKSSLLNSPDGQKPSSGPKFQPGDHVIRWELLKAMLWPIQVHGIVLKVEDKSVPSTDNDNDTDEHLDLHEIHQQLHQHQSKNYVYTIADFGYTSSQQSIDEEENKNVVLKQIGNINEKMKSFYNNAKALRPSSSAGSSKSISDDSYMDINQIPSYDSSIMNNLSAEIDKTSAEIDEADATSSELINDMKSMDIKDLDAAFDNQNDNNRERKRFQVIEIADPEDAKKWHKIDYGKSLLRKNKITEKMAESGRNLLKKLSFRSRKTENYSTLALDQDEAGKSAIPQSLNDNSPKLPESDPSEIVLARTRYIIDQQDLPKSEQTLPPYHILYSNSECLAVWCKTGKFSTLQAAVFLHSTAVGSAKSTFLMTGAVAATQPWLIPVVGIYGVVGIGMPYLLLKKCKEKWRISEQQLTDGFWSTANPEAYISAIENWSGIGCKDHVTENET